MVYASRSGGCRALLALGPSRATPDRFSAGLACEVLGVSRRVVTLVNLPLARGDAAVLALVAPHVIPDGWCTGGRLYCVTGLLARCSPGESLLGGGCEEAIGVLGSGIVRLDSRAGTWSSISSGWIW